MVVMVVLMIVAAAGALVAVVVVVVMMLVLLVIVVMIVTAAAVVIIVVVVVMVVLMVVSAAAIIVIVVIIVVMVVMLVLMLELLHLRAQAVLVHRLKDLLAADLVERGSNEAGVMVQGAEHVRRGLYLGFGGDVGTAHDDEIGVLDLVVEEFAEVAHIHAALAGVDNGDLRADVRALDVLHSLCNVGQLADA